MSPNMSRSSYTGNKQHHDKIFWLTFVQQSYAISTMYKSFNHSSTKKHLSTSRKSHTETQAPVNVNFSEVENVKLYRQDCSTQCNNYVVTFQVYRVNLA